MIPASEISPQALALLNYYPYPNFPGGTQYNYQIPLLGVTHQDSLQTRLNKTIGRKDQLSFLFALQSTRSDNPNLFGFLDTSNVLGLNLNANWRHHFSPRFFVNLGYQFSRSASRFTPFFENRENISAIAQIAGNNQEPINWGPPTLTFASGFLEAFRTGCHRLRAIKPAACRSTTFGLAGVTTSTSEAISAGRNSIF